MKTCPNCGERVYRLGCTWCDEAAYIEEQAMQDLLCAPCGRCGSPECFGACEQCDEVSPSVQAQRVGR